MATNAELEYLRRQNARAKANVANGVQIINQGESEETQDTSWSSLAQSQGLMQEQAPAPKQEEKNDNWLSNVFGFVDELAAQFGAGFVGAFEGIADLGATALGALGDATGWYDSEPFTDWASVDYASKAAEWTKNFANYTPWGIVNSVKNLGDEDYRRNWLAGLFGGPAAALVQTLRDDVDAGSQYYDYNDQALNDFKIGDFEAGNFLGGAAHSVGFMLPSIAMGGGNQIASLASMGASAAGKGSEEALNDGANAGQALAYGAATGAAEVASEVVVGKALGVVGLGTGKVAGLVGNGVQRQAAKTGSRTFVKELIKTMNEEGMEEVSTALLEPIFKSIYKGDEALKDSTGKNIYASTEFWFGKDGHFNESVIGQYASGAFVGGMSNAIQSSSVVKKVGWEGYQALHEWANMAEADAKFSKEAIKQKLSPESAEYASLENERGESANAFIEALDKFMAKATESQKREFARYLTQDGALFRDLQKDRNKDKAEAEIIDEYISKIRSDAGTHEGMVKRSYINQLQDQFGSDYEFDFADLGTDEAGHLKQAQIDRESKVITLNSALLKEKGGALLAHEYVQHTLGNSIKPLQADMFSALQETQSKAWKDSVEEAIAPDLKELEKQAKAEGWDSEKLERAKTDLRQDEYAAYFLEDTFNQVNLDSQVLALKQAFKKQGAIKRFMNRLKGIPNFKISQLATNYIQSIGNFFKGLQRAYPNNPIMLALAKNAYGITLTDAEKRMKAEFGDIFKAVEKTEKLAVQNSVDRNVDKRGYLQDDNGKRIIVNYDPFDDSYSIAKDQTTVADYRIASADPYRMFVKSEHPVFVPYGIDKGEAAQYYEQGFDTIVDVNDEVWVKSEDQLVSAGEEYGKGKRFNLGDEADRRRFGELSDEAFKEYIGTSGGIRTVQEGKAYIEEIEKRHLYKINETYLEDSYGSKVVNDEEHIIPREYYTSRMKAVADLAMKMGAKEVLFYSKTTKYLQEQDAVGLFDPDINTIYVDASVWQVNVNDVEGSELWGADQIARHELGHFLLNKHWFDKLGYTSLIRDAINAEKPFSAHLEAIFKKYRRRWAHYYNDTTTEQGDFRIYEEMFVQLWSESLLMPTEEGRAWQNKLIKDINKTYGIEKSEFNAFRYSKSRDGGANTVNDVDQSADFGFHAGDLGKADFYKEMFGRGTGHFGTGTYFVSDEKILGDYNSRNGKPAPHHKVDFSKYNLYRPASNEDGLRLHSALKAINDYAHIFADSDILEGIQAYIGLGDNPDFDGAYYDDIVALNKAIDAYNALSGEDIKRVTFDDDTFSLALKAYHAYRKISDGRTMLNAEIAIESFDEHLNDLKRWFGDYQTEKALEAVYKNARKYANEGGRANVDSRNWDSLSTVFMKSLGYDGIDVRNLTELDNVNYGSVIYDLDKIGGTIRYSRKRETSPQNVSSGEGELVDSPKIEVEKSKVEIPNEYVKDSAQLYNEKVFAYREATKMVREMSAEIFKALGFNPKDAYIRYNEGNIYKTTKALFDLFNKKKVTDVEIANGILELFSNISVIPKDGNAVALFGEYQNFADNSAIQEIVKKHLVDFTLSGKDSYTTRVKKRMEAFAAVYKQMRASLIAYARDMRERIDASHTLRQTARNMGDGIDETVTLNGTAEQNRLTLRTQMGSVLAAPLLNIIYKRNGNFGTLLKTQQNLADEIHRAIENYTQEYYDKSEDRIMFPFDSELRQMMEDLEESLRRLPAPKTRKDGVVIYPNLTTSQIKQVTAILKAIKKLNAKSVRHYRDVLTPRVKGARKVLKAQESGKLYRLLWANPYTFNAASFYAIINARLGNSVFAYNTTVGMELADGKRKAYVGDTAKMLSSKIEELKIEKELAKVVTFHGVEMQVGHLIDLYCGLKSYDFDNFDKNGVTFKDKKGVVHKVVEAGEANQALADVEAALSDSAKAYGDWLLNELYNKRFMEDYIAYKEERGYHHAQVSGNYYPQSADLSDTPTDFTKLVRAPKIFQNDKARVKHNHAFVLHDASRRAMQYANDMGTALYVYPQYEDNFYVLKQIWTDLGNNPTDIKFRDSLATTLGMWVGLDVKGNKSVKGPMNFLIGNYSRTLLSFNVGTPFKQTISLLFSNLSLPNALKGVTNRLFGSSEFKAEFKSLAENFSQMAYRAIGSETLKLDMSTGAGKIVYYLRKLSDYGMKPIEWFDNATIQAGLSASMVVARDMGYEMGTEEFRKVTEDLFSVFVETQIGSNPSNLSRIARGDSPLGAIGQYASFMQGPMRAALAAFVDKVTTWRTARKWTAQEIRQAIETASDKVDVAQEAYDESAKKLADLENKRREIKESEDLEQEEKEAEIAKIKESIEQAKADVEIKADELAEAKSELEQAEQNQKTFIKYRAQGGNAWFVSTVSSMAVGAVINAIIEALARRIKGKEEWDEWDGKELMENAVLYGTVGWLPLASTITNAVKGYDSSYPTGAIFQEASAIISAVSSAIQNGFDEKSAKALFREMVQALSIATGLPIKNIYSIVYGTMKAASPIMAEEMNGVFYMNYQNNAKIVKAIESGDEALAIHRISELATANCGEINESVKREYLALMQAGESPMPSAIPTSYTNEEGESITISWTQQQTAKKFYSRANSQIAKLLSDRTYRSLKESVRASIVRAIYTAYRQAALAKALGAAYDAKLTKQALLAKTGDARTGAILSAVAYIRSMEATGDKTKKELAIAYVNKLNMTKGERLIVLKMAGYGVDEVQLRQALQQKGMSYSEASTFIG